MRAEYPPGLTNAYSFAVFNALSYQMILGSPMILYAKTLGASATVLGIIAGMMPLLVIFQIPAARHVAGIGYKRFVFAGWGTRVTFIFVMALVPLSGVFLGTGTQLSLMLMLLFGFNLSRGISSCAWLPWITSLVPEALRGQYLAREAACVNVASAAVFGFAALCLGSHPHPWQFAVIFVFSAAMGAVSLVFLRRMPEGESIEQTKVSAAAVPWREILNFPPFRKILWMNFTWSVGYGGLTAFVVAFLKMEGGMSEKGVLLVTAMSFLGGLGSLWLLGRRLDHWGSKPALQFSALLWVLIVVGWALVAGGALKPGWWLLVGLQVAMGLALSMYNMSNTRLAMMTIPFMGRNHFFVLFSVVSNLTQGIAPVLWGMMIDALGSVRMSGLGMEWNRFSIFFGAVAAVLLVATLLCLRLEEPQARQLDEMMKDLLMSPVRLGRRIMGLE